MARYLDKGTKTIDKSGNIHEEPQEDALRRRELSHEDLLRKQERLLAEATRSLPAPSSTTSSFGSSASSLPTDRVVGKGTTTARLTSRRTSQSATEASGVDNFLLSDPNFLHVFFFTHSYPPSAPPVTTGGRPNIGRTTTGATDSWTWATTREQDLGSNSSDWRSARFFETVVSTALGCALLVAAGSHHLDIESIADFGHGGWPTLTRAELNWAAAMVGWAQT